MAKRNASARKASSVEAQPVAVAEPAPEETVTSIKGFDTDMRCRGFAFEFGKSYSHDGPVVACESGFHAIEGHPLEVLGYYAPALSRYAEVTQSGQLARHDGDSKVASAKITIGVEVHLHELAQRAVKWVQAHAPRGLLFGDHDIQKWRNLTLRQRGELDGTMLAESFRHGPVTVRLKCDIDPAVPGQEHREVA